MSNETGKYLEKQKKTKGLKTCQKGEKKTKGLEIAIGLFSILLSSIVFPVTYLIGNSIFALLYNYFSINRFHPTKNSSTELQLSHFTFLRCTDLSLIQLLQNNEWNNPISLPLTKTIVIPLLLIFINSGSGTGVSRTARTNVSWYSCAGTSGFLSRATDGGGLESSMSDSSDIFTNLLFLRTRT